MTNPHGADSAEIERLRAAFEDRVREPYRKDFEGVPWHVLERSETDTRFYRNAETREEWETFQAGASALAALRTPPDDAVKLREVLEWYGEQARLCRLIHSGGDAGRQALDADGGRRARAALKGTDDAA